MWTWRRCGRVEVWLELEASVNYFLKAVEGVRENKQRFADAEAQAMLKPKPSPPRIPGFIMRQLSGGREGKRLTAQSDRSLSPNHSVGRNTRPHPRGQGAALRRGNCLTTR